MKDHSILGENVLFSGKKPEKTNASACKNDWIKTKCNILEWREELSAVKVKKKLRKNLRYSSSQKKKANHSNSVKGKKLIDQNKTISKSLSSSFAGTQSLNLNIERASSFTLVGKSSAPSAYTEGSSLAEETLTIPEAKRLLHDMKHKAAIQLEHVALMRRQRIFEEQCKLKEEQIRFERLEQSIKIFEQARNYARDQTILESKSKNTYSDSVQNPNGSICSIKHTKAKTIRSASKSPAASFKYNKDFAQNKALIKRLEYDKDRRQCYNPLSAKNGRKRVCL
eukprot:TRINITY_DN14025_c0_g1_i1.p1 TRINITY_DN14025_c0_g1~~TRINITY_DN14025_c0_g1_i1.p1  ORF type:complete len:282 (-),score=24.71 TRINITY_DN14025_c0_g1_i1:256-1101(-)